MKNHEFFTALSLICLLVTILVVGTKLRHQGDAIRDLKVQVACLRSPTHGESSITVRMRNGKPVVTRGPSTTVC